MRLLQSCHCGHIPSGKERYRNIGNIQKYIDKAKKRARGRTMGGGYADCGKIYNSVKI